MYFFITLAEDKDKLYLRTKFGDYFLICIL